MLNATAAQPSTATNNRPQQYVYVSPASWNSMEQMSTVTDDTSQEYVSEYVFTYTRANPYTSSYDVPTWILVKRPKSPSKRG